MWKIIFANSSTTSQTIILFIKTMVNNENKRVWPYCASIQGQKGETVCSCLRKHSFELVLELGSGKHPSAWQITLSWHRCPFIHWHNLRNILSSHSSGFECAFLVRTFPPHYIAWETSQVHPLQVWKSVLICSSCWKFLKFPEATVTQTVIFMKHSILT